jgi:hypothetical protein
MPAALFSFSGGRVGQNLLRPHNFNIGSGPSFPGQVIDEPEAFLHPPQARLIGSSLVQDRRDNRQLFIATHSADILSGVLNTTIFCSTANVFG